MTGIIIQARMGSSRLPGKVLMNIHGKPLLAHIVDRTNKIKNCQIVVATSLEQKDDVLAEFCETKKIDVFRGSEQNVLERYVLCARKYGFDNIVRLTADNPFVDREELEKLITFHKKGGYDFSFSDEDLPEGVGAEIFTMEALEESLRFATEEKHFEHVDEYILDHRSEYRMGRMGVSKEKTHPEISFTVDTEDDYRKVCYIAEQATREEFSTEEAIEFYQEYVREG